MLYQAYLGETIKFFFPPFRYLHGPPTYIPKEAMEKCDSFKAYIHGIM